LKWIVFAMLAACSSKSSEPKVIETKAGPIEVVDKIPEGAEFMCSADLAVHPMTELHVIPMYNSSLDRYVGSYRCNADWKAAIEEVRTRLHANPTQDEAAMFLQVFLERGAEGTLRPLVEGKKPMEAAEIALDAIGSGKIVLTP
jgi:hypothetical protein